MSLIHELITVAECLPEGGFAALTTHVDAEWVDEALTRGGVGTLRKRRLPADRVVWLVIGMALLRDRSVIEVARQLDIALPGHGSQPLAPSAAVQARQRIGAKPLKELFATTARHWTEDAWGERWHGMQVFAMDGSTMAIADSEANAKHFGRHHSGKHRTASGYPALRMVWLMGTRSRMVHAAQFDALAVGEMTLAKRLLPSIPAESILILDRLYIASPFLLPLVAQHGRHFLVRTKSSSRWTVVETLGEDDAIVEVRVSDEARAADASLPKSYRARAVTSRRGTSSYVLLTSLVDASKYPSDEIRALYAERWEAEVGFDEFKAEMLDDGYTLRSRTVDGVEQELWGALIAYNLVRREMACVAKLAKLPPNRISFVMALSMFIDAWTMGWITISPGTLPKRLDRMRDGLARMILPPRRSRPSYPRVVKRKESKYPRKKTPVAGETTN